MPKKKSIDPKQQARLEQIKTLSSVGTSLLTMNKGTA